MGGHGGTITKAWHTIHDWSGWHAQVRGRGPSVAYINPIQAMARP